MNQSMNELRGCLQNSPATPDLFNMLYKSTYTIIKYPVKSAKVLKVPEVSEKKAVVSSVLYFCDQL